MIVAFISDKARHRFLFAICPLLIALAGLGMLLNIHGQENRDAQYGALFMLTCGCYSAMPVIVCWFAMNLGGHRRRSVGTAWQVGFGNRELSTLCNPATLTNSDEVGGIISTFCFREEDKPGYRPGYIISLSFLCFSAAMCILYLVACWRDNTKRDRAGTPELSEEDEEEMGDMAPTFRYNY